MVSTYGGPIQTDVLVEAKTHPKLGTILMDRSGRTQYLFTADQRNQSNCSEGCALAWPPLLTMGKPMAGEGLSADHLGTITRDEGSLQVTYNGWPLHYFANDAGPGEANGQDLGNVWFVVSTHGGPIQTDVLVEAKMHPDLGTILMDRSGRTQYLFTADELKQSNCTEGCALAWPPLLTVGEPTAGEGLSADHLGTITRDQSSVLGAYGTTTLEDGSLQVTYNGWPLYYFANDAGPGEANGQDIGNVWFVVSTYGGPIQTDVLVETKEHPDLRTILTDRSGRTQYLFTPDNRDVSNCADICALFWPPLLTVGDPTPGANVSADQLGTIERDDGSTQVTYSGWPLYYFAFDTMPGDTNGQDSQDAWYVVSTYGGPIQTAALVETSDHADLGTILTDRSGRTQYLFTPDNRDVSNCADICALFWPPLLTVGDPTPGENVSVDQLGTIERDDGSTQVTYNGWPLYYFAFDTMPGDTNGQDSQDAWYVVSTYGGPIQTAALVETSDHADLGTILTDRSGRTQYLFTPDNRDVSNCADICALFWPPLLTVGDPTPGEGVSADQLGTIERDDGSTQVTYNGWPLYYFAFDTMPGDTNGQDSQDAWYVVSTYGGPIQTNVLVEAKEHPDLGTILMDRSGRTQYMFTADERSQSNCSGECV